MVQLHSTPSSAVIQADAENILCRSMETRKLRARKGRARVYPGSLPRCKSRKLIPSMPAPLSITVLIPTFNEERNLQACLDSVSWADEILVVDSLSSDRTVAIAVAAGARVIAQKCVTIEQQKNWAMPQCSHDWVLIVDADERLEPAMEAEVRGLLARGDPVCSAYEIRRQTIFLGSRLRFGGLQSDRVTRLFDRRKAHYPDVQVHSDLVVVGKVGRLQAMMIHHTCYNLDDYITKMRRYTTWGANDLWRRGRRCGWVMLVFKPVNRFINMYFLKRGFLDGFPGLVYAGLSAISLYVRWLKLWAMQQSFKRNDRWPDGTRIIHEQAIIHGMLDPDVAPKE